MKTTIYPGWWQVAIFMLAQAISAGSIFTAYSVIAAPLKIEFAPSNMVLMLGLTVATLASGLLSPSLGAAIDRFSIRKLMLIGAGLVVTGFLLMSVATSMIQVIVIYAVFMALAIVLLGPIASAALLARWFTHKRGLAIGIAASGGAIGSLVIPPLLQGLIDGLEWRMALRAFSAVVLVITVPLIAWLVVDRPQQASATGKGDDDTPESAKPEPAQLISMGEALRDLRFWLIALTVGTMFFGPIAVVSNLIQFVGEKGIEPSEGAFLISIFSGANFAGKLILAAAADRLDLRLALAIALTGMGLGVAGLLYSDSFLQLAASCTVTGLFAGAALPLWSVTLAHVYGVDRVGKMMGLMSLVIMPFTLISPPLFGWVYDFTGSYDNALVGYTGMLVLALLLVSQLQLGRRELVRADAAT